MRNGVSSKTGSNPARLKFSRLFLTHPKVMKSYESQVKSIRYNYIYPAVVSLAALTCTFLISNSGLSVGERAALFAAIVAGYIFFTVIFYLMQDRDLFSRKSQKAPADPFTEEVEEKLLILEEASEFFAATLKPADMFRLVTGRIGELIPFSTCVLFLIDEEKKHLKIAQAVGEKAECLKNLAILCDEGLAGKTFQSRKAQTDEKLSQDKKVFSGETLHGLGSAIAVPLIRGGEVFGVLQIFGAKEKCFDAGSLALLEAVGERIVPLLTGSMAFERNLQNALTDSLTNLPNERAFYLVLENQIAEAQRFPEKRNLTVLVMDIKNFGDMNRTYGHSTGDRILAFAAGAIQKQLRRMDFLSRSTGDEFFAVLPTADDDITEKIITRIERAFVLEPFQITEDEKIHIGLSFGFASFLTDGDTANQLLKIAVLKKRQSKTDQENKILWFPKEFVN